MAVSCNQLTMLQVHQCFVMLLSLLEHSRTKHLHNSTAIVYDEITLK